MIFSAVSYRPRCTWVLSLLNGASFILISFNEIDRSVKTSYSEEYIQVTIFSIANMYITNA